LPFNAASSPHRGLAGAHISYTVNHYQTGMTNPNIAKYTSRLMIFGTYMEYPVSGGEQRSGNGFALVGLNRLTVVKKFQGTSSNQVMIQSHSLQSI